MSKHNRISIIGAGPAGIATAIQLKRLGYDPQLFEKDQVGGLLWNANLVENYPGFPKGISGPKLIRLMEKHLKLLDIRVIFSNIEKIEPDEEGYFLSDGKKIWEMDFVVIASGTKPKPIPIDIVGNVQSYVHRDIKKLLNVSGKHIVIVGSGDAAFDHALNLSKRNKISIINRGDKINALPLLVERTLSVKEITYISNTSVYNITSQQSNCREVPFVIHCSLKNGDNLTIGCDAVVYAIGRDPKIDFCSNIEPGAHWFMVGDVKNGLFRQTSIAVGDGILAAMKINEQIIMRNK
jgi:thioredoxin reductase (NADPH)